MPLNLLRHDIRTTAHNRESEEVSRKGAKAQREEKEGTRNAKPLAMKQVENSQIKPFIK